jgi:hypothetical protein
MFSPKASSRRCWCFRQQHLPAAVGVFTNSIGLFACGHIAAALIMNTKGNRVVASYSKALVVAGGCGLVKI